ncbi:MAG: hypothetical protein JXA94_02840, partial [Parachlamydiales bacterium]|nr:hypothetical protein [Parachlamydiales bacterium]
GVGSAAHNLEQSSVEMRRFDSEKALVRCEGGNCSVLTTKYYKTGKGELPLCDYHYSAIFNQKSVEKEDVTTWRDKLVQPLHEWINGREEYENLTRLALWFAGR